ncbi:aldehyde dehydrogenase (NADP(+)) [Aliiglaciecola sp. M165]|uniref:aldehyde dehydrogenase (NADP(+)) n=1 Tax=Aliiglaciecola sp. M165 TaxID=2593649 RepID=UPI00117D8292|nr:aldehyde dehydrogenase (NADP(+)) [Aliiglaciecola sp. M165]TRY29824.1 aldehyde dehydrogenase (NADP(+)) [Aliiglaciecola sp. M165]
MALSGKNLIAGQWVTNDEQNTFSAYLPATDDLGKIQFYNVSSEQVNTAVEAAQLAFPRYRRISAAERASFLQTIAESIMSLGDELLQITHMETGLSVERLRGERQRTINQLNAFSVELLNPSYTDIEEPGDETRSPVPKPSTKLTRIPLGPVAVFGASNFPYAFSTLGGDTVAALAAGCPVVVKAHPAHPGTSELMALAIHHAIDKLAIPKGVFSQFHSTDPVLAHQLVRHSGIKAVGFTGSQKVAELLIKSIQLRSDSIPFYGELGSINPQFVFSEKIKHGSGALAQQLCLSLLMGNGQFCTSPGVWIVPESATDFIETCSTFMSEQYSDTLLTKGIQKEYESSVSALKMNKQLRNIANAKQLQHFHGTPSLFATNAYHFVTNEQLRKEVFGPCAVIVTYKQIEELQQIVSVMEGQLTASVHGTERDFEEHKDLIESISFKVGRLIYNQMPTGVEVCASMNHGGPYPASTDIRSTSVGQQAMSRFLRPLCIQNFSE